MNAQTRRHLAEQAAMVAAQAEDPDSLISTIDQALREWGLEMAKLIGMAEELSWWAVVFAGLYGITVAVIEEMEAHE